MVVVVHPQSWDLQSKPLVVRGAVLVQTVVRRSYWIVRFVCVDNDRLYASYEESATPYISIFFGFVDPWDHELQNVLGSFES